MDDILERSRAVFEGFRRGGVGHVGFQGMLEVSRLQASLTVTQPEDVEPFIVPPLGKHYQDIWDEEDSALPFASTTGTGPPTVNAWDVGGKAAQPPPPRLSFERTYIPVAEMVEEDLWDEAKGLGGLNERAVAALMRVTDSAAQKAAKAGALPAPVDVKPPTTPKGKVPELQVNGDTVSPKMGPPQRTPHREPVDGAALDNEEAIPSWPIRPHRFASPPKRANEREKAATLDVEVAQMEQGVAREMRLLGLMGEEETVSPDLHLRRAPTDPRDRSTGLCAKMTKFHLRCASVSACSRRKSPSITPARIDCCK